MTATDDIKQATGLAIIDQVAKTLKFYADQQKYKWQQSITPGGPAQRLTCSTMAVTGLGIPCWP